TGTGVDTVTVASSRNLVQLGGLLTIDTGGVDRTDPAVVGRDTVTVNDAAATNATGITLTGSTLVGITPTVDEEQTFTVRAESGTYTLLLPGALAGHQTLQLDYVNDDDTTITTKLREAYGTTDIDVTETSDSKSKTFTITFTGAHSGQNVDPISW